MTNSKPEYDARMSLGHKLFFVAVAGMFGHSIVMFTINAEVGLSWFGAFLGSAAVVVFWIGQVTKKKITTARVLLSLLAGSLVGVACAIYDGLDNTWQWLPLGYTVFIFLGTLVYIKFDRHVVPPE